MSYRPPRDPERPPGWDPALDRAEAIAAELAALGDEDPNDPRWPRWSALVLRLIRSWWGRIVARMRRRAFMERAAPLALPHRHW